jgi:peptidoglycan-associated lipoprotein
MEPKGTTEVVTPLDAKTEVVTSAALELTDVFFDYDRFVLRDDARDALTGNGKLLVDSADTQVLLEGHCDERGTVEYNLALGERRAGAVKGYLVQYGVDASRLRTISYGEERPFAPGQDESAWSQNRRVHFVKQ